MISGTIAFCAALRYADSESENLQVGSLGFIRGQRKLPLFLQSFTIPYELVFEATVHRIGFRRKKYLLAPFWRKYWQGWTDW